MKNKEYTMEVEDVILASLISISILQIGSSAYILFGKREAHYR